MLRQLPWLAQAEFSDARLWLIVFSGLLFFCGLLRLLRAKKSRSKALRAMAYGLLIASVTLSYAIILGQWRGYAPVLADREILDLRFTALEGDQRFKVQLIPITLPGGMGKTRVPRGEWEVQGNEWRLSVRQIHEKPWLPMEPRYRLHRLVTRKLPVSEREQRHAYPLRSELVPDLWRIAKRRPMRLPFFEARVVTTDFLPLRDGQTYRIALTGNKIKLRLLSAEDLTDL